MELRNRFEERKLFARLIIRLSRIKPDDRIFYLYTKKCKPFGLHFLLSCGGRIRTCDLQVMSLASYQLLHSAMLFFSKRVQRYKDFSKYQNIYATFLKNRTFLHISFRFSCVIQRKNVILHTERMCAILHKPRRKQLCQYPRPDKSS